MRRPDDVRPRRPAGRGLKPAGAVSLARALSKFGVCSRREAERRIAEGRVRVGGVVECSPSRWIDPAKDRVVLEGEVIRMRAKMGSLRGRALVDGKVVCEGLMTFALGERPDGA